MQERKKAWGKLWLQREEEGRSVRKKEEKGERETDIISQNRLCREPPSTACSRLPGPLWGSSCCVPGLCFLRPAPHSIRSEIHVCLCSTEVLLKVPSWHITFKAFTVYDLGCRWGTLFRDESFPDTSHHGRELYKDPSSWLRICRYLEGDWNGLSWRKAKGIVPD